MKDEVENLNKIAATPSVTKKAAAAQVQPLEYATGLYVMNTMARYLGALERSTPGTVSKIVYGDTEYTWDSTANLKGSNWKSTDGKTLVDAITATQPVSKVDLKLVDANDYSIDVVFQVTQ